MPDATCTKLLAFLDTEHPPELRSAAVLVLGEMRQRTDEIAEAIANAVNDADGDVRVQALVAVGKLRVEQALPRLLERITEGGIESELAAQAAARLGARGTKALTDLMGKVAPGLRRRIAGAMGGGGTTTSETAAVDALLDTDPGVVDAAASSLLGEMPTLTPAHRRALADHLLALLGQAKGRSLSLASETAVVRLLGALGETRAAHHFWQRIGPARPAPLRATALQAVGKLPSLPPREKLREIFACAADADFRVAAPALMLLRALPVNDKAVDDWLPLFDAPDAAARRLALEKLGERDTPKIADGLLKQITHHDAGLREEAGKRLAQAKHGRKALASALLAAESADDAWALARAQAEFAGEIDKDQRGQLFKKACTYLEENDRRADALLFLARAANANELRDQFAERAVKERKKKQYEKALIFFRLLARDPACSAAIRFEQAACGLRVSSHDVTADARAADPCLQQFAQLINSQTPELMSWVEKAKWLEPEDLFYLGFHFAEKGHQERKFAADVLRLLLKRSPKSKLAKDARAKLRGTGLE